MIRERENKNTQHFGMLVMRAYNIAGNLINAFYDSSDNLVFVLDNTINATKPNVLLVINPDGDKKWDEILSSDYDVDLETIRPKQDNKYQKLDIEYSGLPVYDNLIQSYLADDDMEDFLVQLNILRESAARHSAMARLNMANEVIAKTNTTIVKTKESIVRLQTRAKTLRAKLSATKKEIGKVPTKQSAARVLKIESQIEATNEKIKRAQKRLESAQRRLESATVDAELASDLLNQPTRTVKRDVKHHNKPLTVAPKYEVQTIDSQEDDYDESDDDEISDDAEIPASDVKPLFDKDPEILNEDIAFKPISFDAPTFTNIEPEQPVPMLNSDVFSGQTDLPEPVKEEMPPIVETFKPLDVPEYKPVIETFEPIASAKESETFVEEEKRPVLESFVPMVESDESENIPEPVVQGQIVEPEMPRAPIAPVAPVATVEPQIVSDKKSSKPTLIYYVLLMVLIALSIFTLWLYQKNIQPTTPVLMAKVEQTVPVSAPRIDQPVVPVAEENIGDTEEAFIDEPEIVVESEMADETIADNEPEPFVEPELPEESTEDEEYDEEDIAPEIVGAVPARVMTSVGKDDNTDALTSEEEILDTKPIYEPGGRYDNNQDVFYDDESYWGDDYFYDAEEAAYQAGDTGYDE